MVKAVQTISLDAALLEKVRESGINISETCQAALYKALDITEENAEANTVLEQAVTGDLNKALSDLKAEISQCKHNEYWDEQCQKKSKWLKNQAKKDSKVVVKEPDELKEWALNRRRVARKDQLLRGKTLVRQMKIEFKDNGEIMAFLGMI